MPAHKYTLQERISAFWSKVDKSPHPKDCWIWIAGRDKDGYGIFQIEGSAVKAHRLSYQLANGSFDRKLLVLHSCDNPSCVNPDHLSLGSSLDNARDRSIKHRSAFGERSPLHKLTWSQVIDIRARYATGLIMQKTLAEEYGVHRDTISRIVCNEHWHQLAIRP